MPSLRSRKLGKRLVLMGMAVSDLVLMACSN